MIVIVGAGLAGLSAAHALIELGYDDLLIIEAKARAGGRIDCQYFNDGTRVDLGAQWLHGAEGNPIYHWLQECNCIEGLEEEEVEFEGMYKLQGGETPSMDLISKILELLLDTKHTLYKMSTILRPNSRPVDIYRSRIADELSKCPVLKSANPKVVEAVVKWFELYEAIDNSCEDLSQLSMRAYSEWTDYDDGQMVKLKGGWQNVVAQLVEEIGDNRILFESPVEKISLSNDQVTVQHTNGLLFCEHVIVTLPVGVLKTIPRNFFDPPLPIDKVEGIIATGYGVTNKIFLRFKEAFLQEEKGVKFLWTGERLEDHKYQNLPEWCKYITGLNVYTESPNVLLAWIGCEGARSMEAFSNQEIGAICLRVLQIFLPNTKPPELLETICSRWASDCHIKGAYSYESVQGSYNERDHLWDPISRMDKSTGKLAPRILFAGEATAESMYSTAHGAIASGWREANRLANYKNQFNNTNTNKNNPNT